ncbi:threonine aldolase family protein [Paenibacillus eucommiae]|uniref:Threonine aldolase n=1 Tax=Paenibacillus eucommiae TaxID=1355755 RepID=A0ABS4J5I6_9BACL|nr:GntG family PLP-dependent aldolase [Paenibacillus eucommiae]MBP1995104.1 threonine aldolase [Paenibacillus eucommiae]
MAKENDLRLIDLSTDARTLPTDEMWEAMRRAELGWVSRGEDASVNALLARIQELTGKEAAILLPSCTMANLIALMTHASRGDQVILEESSHIAWSEGWGICSIAGLLPKGVQGAKEKGGRIEADDLILALEEEKFSHRPKSALLCLENTNNAYGGTVLTPAYTSDICGVARERGLAIHLDGARIFNAAAALKQPVKSLVEPVDSVAINLNKGLSAPEGALLCGSQAFVQRARVIAKALGGDSMHKAGIIAAAGVIALNNMMEQLSEDHRRARSFAEAIQGIPGVEVDMSSVQTNIVMADISASGLDGRAVLQQLEKRNVAGYLNRAQLIRFVFHRHINDEDVARAAAALAEVIGFKGKGTGC